MQKIINHVKYLAKRHNFKINVLRKIAYGKRSATLELSRQDGWGEWVRMEVYIDEKSVKDNISMAITETLKLKRGGKFGKVNQIV